ncbi:hypothetical protein GCM10017557_40870 [Streptomyces aurantiacus]|uniref:Uncharacterized protein n=1 Tax=Streptomyces aurantiacus TaxID=47760 RepID=A0A7G1P1F0_9ACTN|nr:hypothetical protein GCM10017557_40870 [Streptomyces aurantiacus]
MTGRGVREAAPGNLAEKVAERFVPCGVRDGAVHEMPRDVRAILNCGFGGVKGVYRHVLTLASEWRLWGWFARDSVGNSDLATS